MQNTYEGLIEDWKVELIRLRAFKKGFRSFELPDVEQEIALALLKFEYKSEKSNGACERTVFTRVIDNKLNFIIRCRMRRQNAVQRYGVLTSSESEGYQACLHLKHDVENALSKLTETERSICEALSKDISKFQIAKSMNISRYEVELIINRIRESFLSRQLDSWVTA